MKIDAFTDSTPAPGAVTVDVADVYPTCDFCFRGGELFEMPFTRKALGDPEGPDYPVRLCAVCRGSQTIAASFRDDP